MANKKNLLKNFSKGAIKKDKKIIQTVGIKQNITIIPELLNLIPPLKDDELEALEENILKNGCRDSLLVWEHEEQYILVDGHNRYSICSKHGLDFNIKILHFADIQEVKDYMIDNQLGRRNLTPEQASYLRGLKYNREKLEKGKYDRDKYKGQNDPYDEGISTSERLAKEFNVSEKTVKRDAQYAAGLDKIGKFNQGLKHDILSGKIKVKKGEIQELSKLDDDVEVSKVEDISGVLEKKNTKKTTQNNLSEVEASKKRILNLTSRIKGNDDNSRAACEELKQEIYRLEAQLNA
ncbi:ParB N-terminal domain-containing protein [Rapidithrix thailandica]|uniref:ParB N-terminal domain-containing protein n=1 Tax=Rapidithrix thailandica TaxID=413964 RepID=A0AAW9SHZ1_9BACT